MTITIFNFPARYSLYGANASNPNKGVLAVHLNGSLGTVCYNNSLPATVACLSLGFTSLISIKKASWDVNYSSKMSCEKTYSQVKNKPIV